MRIDGVPYRIMDGVGSFSGFVVKHLGTGVSHGKDDTHIGLYVSYDEPLTSAQMIEKINAALDVCGLTNLEPQKAQGIVYGWMNGTTETFEYYDITEDTTATIWTGATGGPIFRFIYDTASKTAFGHAKTGTDATAKWSIADKYTSGQWLNTSPAAATDQISVAASRIAGYTFVGETSGKIVRQDYADGQNITTIVADGTYVPTAMSWNETDGLLYFIDTAGTPRLMKIAFDGSGATQVASMGAGTYTWIVHDHDNNVFYYVKDNKIGKINADGTGQNDTWYTPPTYSAKYLDIEPNNGSPYVWYTDSNGDIRKIEVVAGAAGTDTLVKATGRTLLTLGVELTTPKL